MPKKLRLLNVNSSYILYVIAKNLKGMITISTQVILIKDGWEQFTPFYKALSGCLILIFIHLIYNVNIDKILSKTFTST